MSAGRWPPPSTRPISALRAIDRAAAEASGSRAAPHSPSRPPEPGVAASVAPPPLDRDDRQGAPAAAGCARAPRRFPASECLGQRRVGPAQMVEQRTEADQLEADAPPFGHQVGQRVPVGIGEQRRRRQYLIGVASSAVTIGIDEEPSSRRRTPPASRRPLPASACWRRHRRAAPRTSAANAGLGGDWPPAPDSVSAERLRQRPRGKLSEHDGEPISGLRADDRAAAAERAARAGDQAEEQEQQQVQPGRASADHLRRTRVVATAAEAPSIVPIGGARPGCRRRARRHR